MSIDVRVPSMGESVATATIARWRKAPGDPITMDEAIVELDSDKASLELPSPAAGVVEVLLAQVGDEVKVGDVIARIAAVAVTTAPQASSVVVPSVPPGEARDISTVPKPAPISPAVRQAMREAGVEEVHGSGRGGRVTRADVSAAIRTPGEPPLPEVAPTAPPPAPIPVGVTGPPEEGVEIVPMSTMRRRIAERLVEAQQTAAMLTTFNEIDMSAVMALRERYQERFQKRYGLKLGFMSFFVKASLEALKAFPSANAEIRGTDIVYKRYFHIGVAVSGKRGLVVPVVRDADQLSFAETEQAIGAFGQRARDNTLTVDELRNGTFTISNGGIFGSLLSTPILNPPQVAILGMHAIQKRAVVVPDEHGRDTIVVRPMMYVALTYDHRLLDGREAVGFLVRIKECVEDPERLLLEV